VSFRQSCKILILQAGFGFLAGDQVV